MGSPRLCWVTATSHRPLTATRVRARRMLALLLALPLLAACNNFGAQTDQVYTPAQGTNSQDASIDVLNAAIVSEDDGSGRLIAGLANNTDEDVALTLVQGVGEGADVQFGTDGGDNTIPGEGFLQLADEDVALISATGEQVVKGYYVRLLMVFDNGEEVELNVPVVEPGEDFADVVLPSDTDTPPTEG